MPGNFQYDLFLSHSSKDKPIVRPLAERLRADGLRVWLDEWEIKPGDSIPAKIEEGLENSRVLVLCMSANAFGSDWSQLESYTFRFRDPLNKARRFLPLRLDDAPIAGSLAQFRYIAWQNSDARYTELLQACRSVDPDPGSSNINGKRAHDSAFLRAVAKTRSNEWQRLRSHFESEAAKYHDCKFAIFYITRGGPTTCEKFPEPNHAINLWQYYGTALTAREKLPSAQLTIFGITEAEVSAFGIVMGDQTKLFHRMATHAGSLLPNKLNLEIVKNVGRLFADSPSKGKPITITNRDPFAKWLNFLLIATATSHPQRLETRTLPIDPFAASVVALDFFDLGH